MANLISPLIERAHGVQLFGYEHPSQLERDFQGYQGLGATPAPYDFAAPGAVAEVKRALRALAAAEADPFKKGGAEVVTETTWKQLDETDVWSHAAGEEMLLAVSRYRGTGWAPEPYVQLGPIGGAPQPRVMGLELIASAVNERLGGAVPLLMYETWRKTGCSLVNPCFKPPSGTSRPDPNIQCLPTGNIGTVLIPPPGASAESLTKIKIIEATQTGLWQSAQMAANEATRKSYAEQMEAARLARDAAVVAATQTAPPPAAPPLVTKPPEKESSTGTYVVVGLLVAAAAGGVYWATKGRRR